MSIVFNGTTPEAMRDSIAKWLKDQAIAYRSAGRISRLKKTQLRDFASAGALEAAAKLIEEIIIEKPKPVYDRIIMSQSVDDWIKSGQLITAIKRRRVDTNEGLKEAKDYCEKRRAELGLG